MTKMLVTCLFETKKLKNMSQKGKKIIIKKQKWDYDVSNGISTSLALKKKGFHHTYTI